MAKAQSSDRKQYWLMKAEPNSRIVKGKDVKFSVDDFAAVRTSSWEGVRNHEAKNLMKSMRVGDKVRISDFFARLEEDEGVMLTLVRCVGLDERCYFTTLTARPLVVKEAYPDCRHRHRLGSVRDSLHYTFMVSNLRENDYDSMGAVVREHPYFDPKTDKDKPKWFMVDVTFVARATHFVPLSLLRQIASLAESEPPDEVGYIGSEGVEAVKGMALVNRGRLSVQRVEEDAWGVIEMLAEKGGWDEEKGKIQGVGEAKGKSKTKSNGEKVPEKGKRSGKRSEGAERKRKASSAVEMEEDGEAVGRRTRARRNAGPAAVSISPPQPQPPPTSLSPSDHEHLPPSQDLPSQGPTAPSSDITLHDPSQELSLAQSVGAGQSDPAGAAQQVAEVLNQDILTHDAMNAQSVGQDVQVDQEGVPEEGQSWLPDGHDLKRVKVYELENGRSWMDRGTAFCFGHYDDATQEALLIARSESDYNNVILQTIIRSSDVYQRQQGSDRDETLIVWTEPNGLDYALSFQDPEGCAEVWQFILEVQRIHQNGSGGEFVFLHRPSSNLVYASEERNTGSSSPLHGSGSESGITGMSIVRNGLPQPALGIIGDIDRAIKALSRNNTVREKICDYIKNVDYLKAMIDVMIQAEDLECIDDLQALCSLTQTILTMNDPSLFEYILDDELFLGVIGMLEYDPEFPGYKANYREFFRAAAHFHQPIPMDLAIQKKVHHTYRLQFLKDVALARIIDDSTHNVLTSAIIYSQFDIVSHVQSNVRFLRDVVSLYVDVDGGAKKADKIGVDSEGATVPSGVSEADAADALFQRRHEVLMLVQQLCVMGKAAQIPTRVSLFKTLVDRGLVHVVEWALAQPEATDEGRQSIAVGAEVLMTLLETDLTGVREFALKQLEQAEGAGSSLVPRLCEMMTSSRDLVVQTLMGDALRLILEMPLQDGPDPMMPAKLFARPKDDGKIEKFLELFYKQCIGPLMKPIFDLPDHKQLKEPTMNLTRERANICLSLCDLLSNFTLQHSFRSHFFMLTSKISGHVATLLFSRDRHLRLAALRYFRIHLRKNNRNFIHHLIKEDIFQAIVKLMVQESRRDTLVNSSCQEFFEHIRKDGAQENMKDVIADIMTRQEAQVKQLAEGHYTGSCFRGFIRRWEMNTAPAPLEEEQKPQPPVPLEIRRLEAEEESYFNADDDDDDNAPPLLTAPLLSRQFAGQKRKRQTRLPGMPMRPLRPSSILLPRPP
ncbi:hypothetical protein EW146_g6920, partial [Bondarzewia mesenterica]